TRRAACRPAGGTLASAGSRRRCLAPRDLRSFPTRRSSDLDAGADVNAEARPFAVASTGRRGGTAAGQTAIFGAAFWGWDEVVRRSEEHTSELQSREKLVCRLLLEKKNAQGLHRTARSARQH